LSCRPCSSISSSSISSSSSCSDPEHKDCEQWIPIANFVQDLEMAATSATRCPKCHSAVETEDEKKCMQMHCETPGCGTNFCYMCGEKLEGTHDIHSVFDNRHYNRCTKHKCVKTWDCIKPADDNFRVKVTDQNDERFGKEGTVMETKKAEGWGLDDEYQCRVGFQEAGPAIWMTADQLKLPSKHDIFKFWAVLRNVRKVIHKDASSLNLFKKEVSDKNSKPFKKIEEILTFAKNSICNDPWTNQRTIRFEIENLIKPETNKNENWADGTGLFKMPLKADGDDQHPMASLLNSTILPALDQVGDWRQKNPDEKFATAITISFSQLAYAPHITSTADRLGLDEQFAAHDMAERVIKSFHIDIPQERIDGEDEVYERVVSQMKAEYNLRVIDPQKLLDQQLYWWGFCQSMKIFSRILAQEKLIELDSTWYRSRPLRWMQHEVVNFDSFWKGVRTGFVNLEDGANRLSNERLVYGLINGLNRDRDY